MPDGILPLYGRTASEIGVHHLRLMSIDSGALSNEQYEAVSQVCNSLADRMASTYAATPEDKAAKARVWLAYAELTAVDHDETPESRLLFSLIQDLINDGEPEVPAIAAE